MSDSNLVSKLDLDSLSDFDLISESVSISVLDSNSIYSTFSDPKPPKLSSIISATRIPNFAFMVIEKIAKEFAKLLKEVSCLIIELK